MNMPPTFMNCISALAKYKLVCRRSQYRNHQGGGGNIESIGGISSYSLCHLLHPLYPNGHFLLTILGETPYGLYCIIQSNRCVLKKGSFSVYIPFAYSDKTHFVYSNLQFFQSIIPRSKRFNFT